MAGETLLTDAEFVKFKDSDKEGCLVVLVQALKYNGKAKME